jgi:hypothetical protein
MSATLKLGREDHAAVLSHLQPRGADVEQAAFGFATTTGTVDGVTFDMKEWFPVPAAGFAYQGGYHIELTDETRAAVIKRAWDLKMSLVEFHSHLGPRRGTSFSPSDLEGLEEFVPHVWWRLKGKPYAAVVVGERDLDALAWTSDPRRPEAVAAIQVGDRVMRPTGLTIASLAKKGEA